MEKLTLIAVTVTLLALGCAATTPLSSEERSVQVFKRSDPPLSCKKVGSLYSFWVGEWVEDEFKRNTHQKGGNAFTVDRADEQGTRGTAFDCPSSSKNF